MVSGLSRWPTIECVYRREKPDVPTVVSCVPRLAAYSPLLVTLRAT
jgi:hypothetical protein